MVVFWWVGWASMTTPKVYSRHMNRVVSFIFTFRVKRVRLFFPLEEKIGFFSRFFVLGENELGAFDIILALKNGISIAMNCVVFPIWEVHIIDSKPFDPPSSKESSAIISHKPVSCEASRSPGPLVLAWQEIRPSFLPSFLRSFGRKESVARRLGVIVDTWARFGKPKIQNHALASLAFGTPFPVSGINFRILVEWCSAAFKEWPHVPMSCHK